MREIAKYGDSFLLGKRYIGDSLGKRYAEVFYGLPAKISIDVSNDIYLAIKLGVDSKQVNARFLTHRRIANEFQFLAD